MQNQIQSSIHPQEFISALKKGLPIICIGLIFGLWGQEVMAPTQFSYYGLVAFITTFTCFYFGFRGYLKLKIADRYSTTITWDSEHLWIYEKKEERDFAFKNIALCSYQGRSIRIELTNGEVYFFDHFSERAAQKLITAWSAFH